MRRRDFITLLGSAAAAWPLAARAQQSQMPVIGHLDLGAPDGRQIFEAAFLRGLAELGFVEGGNVTIDYRSAGQEPARLPAMAADLVHKQVAVIFTTGAVSAALAAKAATTTIPIVFVYGGDPVASGVVTSLNRPGANITGVTVLTGELAGKRLDLMHELVPAATTIAYLNAPSVVTPGGLLAAARTLGRQVLTLEVAREADLDANFTTAIERGAGALILSPLPLFASSRKTIARLAAEHKIPVMSFERAFADEGGLISYGANIPEARRIAGTYVGRILKGEKPADLPVVQPTKFELVINLKTAKALGLTVPPTLLVAADDVIE